MRDMTQKPAHHDIEQISRDHQTFRGLIDRLQRGLNRGLDDTAIAARKAELLSFLDGHILFENRVMREINYPISFTHIEEHAAFRERVASAVDEAGKTVAVSNIGKVLKKIHEHHEKYFDAVLCHYLNDKYALTAVDEGLGI